MITCNLDALSPTIHKPDPKSVCSETFSRQATNISA